MATVPTLGHVVLTRHTLTVGRVTLAPRARFSSDFGRLWGVFHISRTLRLLCLPFVAVLIFDHEHAVQPVGKGVL